MLAKVCRKLRVPAPPRGYWAKKAAGHRVAPARLPKLERGQPTFHTFARAPQPREPEPESVAAERARGSVVLPSDTASLHPLVRQHEGRLRRRDEHGDVWARSECLSIDVSKDQLDRGLRIMSALLGAFDERGIAVEVTRPTGDTGGESKTIAVVDGQRVLIGLSEGRRWETPAPDPTPVQADRDGWKRIRDPKKRAEAYAAALLATRLHRVPTSPVASREVWTGKLTLWMSPTERSWRSWGQLRFSDTAHPLEERLHRFVIQLHVVAHRINTVREKQARQAEQRAEEERVRAERERARQHHERLVTDLAQRTSALRQALEIRELAVAVAAREGGSPSALAWVRWARSRADAIEESALDVARAWETA